VLGRDGVRAHHAQPLRRCGRVQHNVVAQPGVPVVEERLVHRGVGVMGKRV
jgi:hypothetical protein